MLWFDSFRLDGREALQTNTRWEWRRCMWEEKLFICFHVVLVHAYIFLRRNDASEKNYGRVELTKMKLHVATLLSKLCIDDKMSKGVSQHIKNSTFYAFLQMQHILHVLFTILMTRLWSWAQKMNRCFRHNWFARSLWGGGWHRGRCGDKHIKGRQCGGEMMLGYGDFSGSGPNIGRGGVGGRKIWERREINGRVVQEITNERMRGRRRRDLEVSRVRESDKQIIKGFRDKGGRWKKVEEGVI